MKSEWDRFNLFTVRRVYHISLHALVRMQFMSDRLLSTDLFAVLASRSLGEGWSPCQTVLRSIPRHTDTPPALSQSKGHPDTCFSAFRVLRSAFSPSRSVVMPAISPFHRFQACHAKGVISPFRPVSQSPSRSVARSKVLFRVLCSASCVL